MLPKRCVAKDTGVPIFGLETNMTAAKDMTCACASQVLEALRNFYQDDNYDDILISFRCGSCMPRAVQC